MLCSLLGTAAAGVSDEHRRVNVQVRSVMHGVACRVTRIPEPLTFSRPPPDVCCQVILRSRPLLQKEIDEEAESILTCRRNEVRVRASRLAPVPVRR